ncbi:YciI family protein [Phytoactinopolyspora endophytica]|uniref:YciI family protein n=1 Tax=Phytoactinopolyspora endophytica TaxID=1642495 RepID=UPI00101D5C58|nr:YciI family protein [Phytoactinopolyspora endophytica]
MKYMIMLYASQREYDLMTGKPTDQPAWSQEDVAAMYKFMESWNQELVETGEFVDARGLTAPVHTRRIHGVKDGVPIVTDGPYAETEEVLAGYTIVECESLDRATEIAARITKSPHPGGEPTGTEYIEVRPIVEGFDDFDVQ